MVLSCITGFLRQRAVPDAGLWVYGLSSGFWDNGSVIRLLISA